MADSSQGIAAATVKVGTAPIAVASGPVQGSVWVANAGSDSVTEISATSLQVLATVPLASTPSSIAVAGNDVWVGSQTSDTVTEISAATAAVAATITVGTPADAPLIVAPGYDRVAVASGSSGSLWWIGVYTGTVSRPYPIGGAPAGLVEARTSGNVDWMTDPSTDSVRVLRAASPPFVTSIPVGSNPRGITYDPATGSVWVANEGDGTISEISTSSDAVTRTISAGVPAAGQFAIAADPALASEIDPRKGYIWVANTASDALQAVSETTGKIAMTIPVGSQPDALAVTWPGIWVANKADGTVTDVSLPVVTMPPAQTYSIGDQVSLQVTATGYPAVTLTAQSLPPGLTMSPTGLVTGTLTEGGVFGLYVVATNEIGSTQGDVYLTVNAPPAAGPTYADQFTVGLQGPSQVLGYISGYPAPTVTVSGLPAGLTVTCGGFGSGMNFTECDVTGIPAPGSGGLYKLTLTGSNGLGSPVSESATVTVDQATAFTSPARVTFRPGRRVSFTIRTSGYPAAGLRVAGRLPARLRLQINSNGTAVISGKVARSVRRHRYRLTITASNGLQAAATQVLIITIS